MKDTVGLRKLLSNVSVDWKPLRDVGEFQRGKRFVKPDLIASGVPCIHYGEMYTHFGVSAERSKSFVSPALASKLRFASKGDVIIVAAGETIEDIGNATAWLSDDDVVIHDACFSFRSPLNAKYVSYFFRTNNFKEQIKGEISSGKISSINAKGLGKAVVPIPCPEDPQKSLAIQAEIVRILDAFTALTAELTAELTARKTQYNYYRNQLLSFEGGEVEWKTLGEVTRIRTGQSINKNMIAEHPGDYPVINSGREPLGYFDQWNTDSDPIGITSRGAGVGSVTWREGKYFRGNLNYSVTIKEPKALNVRFLYHILEQFQPQIKKLCTFDGIPALNAGNLVDLSIPLPAPEEQSRIATILDKFDILTTSLAEGLPREIALRNRQYEHYRNLLLSFPKGDKA